MSHYFIGLSLGQAQEHTALALMQRLPLAEGPSFQVRHLQRYPIGSSYPSMAADLAQSLQREPFRSSRPRLAIDATTVGRPVVEMFKRQRLPVTLRPVLITAGDKVTHEDGFTRIAKRDLVGLVQVALQTRTLRIAATLKDASTLVSELQNFRIKVTESTGDAFLAWREGAHDDLVLAVALALWEGQQAGVTVGKVVGCY